MGIQHLDVSALLQELSSLRAKVRAFNAICSEFEELKSNVKILQQGQLIPTCVPSRSDIVFDTDV